MKINLPKELIRLLEVTGFSKEIKPNGQVKLEKDGSVCNIYVTTGTVILQGKDTYHKDIEIAIKTINNLNYNKSNKDV